MSPQHLSLLLDIQNFNSNNPCPLLSSPLLLIARIKKKLCSSMQCPVSKESSSTAHVYKKRCRRKPHVRSLGLRPFSPPLWMARGTGWRGAIYVRAAIQTLGLGVGMCMKCDGKMHVCVCVCMASLAPLAEQTVQDRLGFDPRARLAQDHGGI